MYGLKKNIFLVAYLFGILFFFFDKSLAQSASDTLRLRVTKIETQSSSLTKAERRILLNALRSAKDSANAAFLLKDITPPNGYLEYTTEIIRFSTPSVALFVSKGPLYLLDTVVWEGLRKNPFTVGQKKRPYLPFWVESRLNHYLRDYENNGYPFAVFKLKEENYRRIQENKIGVRFTYVFLKGPMVRWDSLTLPKGIRESPRFISRLTGLKRGGIYKQTTLSQAEFTLNNSSYYQNAKPPAVAFRGNKAYITLFFEKKKANRFDALLGVLPPQNNTQTFRFSGLIDLTLVSALKWGETFAVRFDWFPPGTQKLDARLLAPYLLGTGLKAEAGFQLLKQDTIFLTRRFEPALGYDFGNGVSAKIFFRNYVSTLLNAKTYANHAWPPPPVLDGSSALYGLGGRYDRVDYLPNPTKGWIFTSDFATGGRTILKNTQLDSLDYGRLGAAIQTRSELTILAKLYIPLYKRRHILAAGLQLFHLWTQVYFDNDLAFIGGARTLRGFNENQFLASSYEIYSVEYRYILDKDAYIGLFCDIGYIKYQNISNPERQTLPIGLGLSLNLKTPAGVITVSYAVGQTETQAFQPVRGRIHIGLINVF